MPKFLKLLFLSCLFLGACSDKDEPQAPPAKEELGVENIYRSMEIDRSASTLTIPLVTNLKAENLKVEQTGTWFVASLKDTENGAAIEAKVRENNTGGRREGTITVKTASKLNSVTINITQLDGDLALDGDIMVKVIDAKASEAQPGQGIEYTYDGNMETGYHSPWSGARFPVKLEYMFSGKDVINYIIYRSGNGNGNFGKFTLYAATDAARSDYKKIGDYNFYEKGGSTVISVPGDLKATAIKFEIHSGLNGHASCKEMEFYTFGANASLNNQLLNVFTDLSCSELRNDVTDEKIDGLNDYFRLVAKQLRDNTYDPYEKDFRIRDYMPYSINVEWADRLMTNIYSDLDNPTGICVENGDEVVVCVGETHGNSVSLQIIGDDLIKDDRGDYLQTQISGPTYLLKEGVNKLTMTQEGQLFIMYHLQDITADNAKPIRIHFAPGSKAKVSGYFDLDEHKTDTKFSEIMGKAVHKKIAIKGERVILYFNRSKIYADKIVGRIQMWDQIAAWEQEFAGIDRNFGREKGKGFYNHIMCISPEANNGQLYLWSSDYRTAYIWSALKNVNLDLEESLSRPGKTWGVAHEFGHFHQKAMNWEPSTETNANIFAHYVNERMGKYTSHGYGLHNLANLRAETNGDWPYIARCDAKYKEINNRMWWQLYIYYAKVLDNKNFYVKVHDYMREKKLDRYNDPGKKQLEFAKACSFAAQEDLTDFFELWGFFKTLDWEYDTGRRIKITDAMVKEAKEYMQQFPKPKHAFEYIEDRLAVGGLDGDFKREDIGDLGYMDNYKQNKQVSGNIKATVSGRRVSVINADGAVCIEIRKGSESGELVYFNNYLTFDIPTAVSTLGCKVYAVQADKKRIHLADI
ncbi:MAG: M60 family metallopeptidase [Muribaculaceae bacterium]|nr:M60 family metallopeptidase [Muribaculaceae bacterium]